MEISFVEGAPAMLIEKEKLLVVGDIHIGRDLALERAGVHVPRATERLAQSLLTLYKRAGARGIVLLGDVKDSIGYPTRDELGEISSFFYRLRDVEIRITKGNHDPRLEEIIRRIGSAAQLSGEILLHDAALMHGHAMPSTEAMMKRYIITAHSHPAMDIGGRMEKVWVVAGLGEGVKERYAKYNRRAELVIAPAFNELIAGSDPAEAGKFVPLLRKNIFRAEDARIYDLEGREVMNWKRPG